jgi:Tol biopolymer transport system component
MERKMKRIVLIIVLTAVMTLVSNSLVAQPQELPSPAEKPFLAEVKIENRRPIWSPDGTKIAFVSYWEKKSDDPLSSEVTLVRGISVVNADGGSLKKLPESEGPWWIGAKLGDWEGCRPTETGDICWSPDSNQIAFFGGEESNEKEGGGDIYVINIDGTGSRNLTNRKGQYHHPSYSPDGKKIAFIANDRGICIMDANGEFWYKLIYGSSYKWSPDGKRIAFTKEGDIGIVDLDGKNQRMLDVPWMGFNFIYHWSPNGKKLFCGNYGYWGPVSLVDLVGVDNFRLRHWQHFSGIDRSQYSVSPDEKCVVFVQDGDIWMANIATFGHPELIDREDPLGIDWTKRKQPSYLKRRSSHDENKGERREIVLNLTKTEKAEENNPCLSPDGTKITFVRNGEIWVMNTNGSNQKQLTFERTEAIRKTKRKQEQENAEKERILKGLLDNRK